VYQREVEVFIAVHKTFPQKSQVKEFSKLIQICKSDD